MCVFDYIVCARFNQTSICLDLGFLTELGIFWYFLFWGFCVFFMVLFAGLCVGLSV